MSLEKYSKKQIRDVAMTALYGMLARLDMNVSVKAKKIIKDASKQIAREIEDEHKKQLKRFRRKIGE